MRYNDESTRGPALITAIFSRKMCDETRETKILVRTKESHL